MAAASSVCLTLLYLSIVWCCVAVQYTLATDDIYYMDSTSYFNGCKVRNLLGEIPVYERDTLSVMAWSSRSKSTSAPSSCTHIFEASGGGEQPAPELGGYGLRVRIVNIELPLSKTSLMSEIVFKEHQYDSEELRRFDRQHRGEVTDVFTRSRFFTIGLRRRGSVDYAFHLTVSRTSVFYRYMDNTTGDCGRVIDVESTQVEFVHAWKVSRNQANHEGTCSITFRNKDSRRLEVAFHKINMGSCDSTLKFHDGPSRSDPQLRSVTCGNSRLPLTTSSLGSTLTVVLNAMRDNTFDFVFTVAPEYTVAPPPLWTVTPTPGDYMTYRMDNSERQCQRPYALPVYSREKATLVGSASRLPRNQTKSHFCLMTFQVSDPSHVIKVFFARLRFSKCDSVLSIYAERNVPVRTQGVSLLYRVTCENYRAFIDRYVFSDGDQLTFVLNTIPTADFEFALEMTSVSQPDPLLSPPGANDITVYLDDFTGDCEKTFEVKPDKLLFIKAWGQNDPVLRKAAPYACDVRMRSSALYAGRGKLLMMTRVVDIPCTSAANLVVYDSINSENVKMLVGSKRCNGSAPDQREIVSTQPYLKFSMTRRNSIDFKLDISVQQTQTPATVSPTITADGVHVYYMDGYGGKCNKTHTIETGEEIQVRAWSHEGRVDGGACALRFTGGKLQEWHSIFWVQFPQAVHFPGQGCAVWDKHEFSKLTFLSNRNTTRTVLQCMSLAPSEIYSQGEINLLLEPQSNADYDFTFNIKHVQAPLKPTRAIVTERPSPLAITAGGLSGILIGSVILLVAVVVVIATVRRGDCQRIRASWRQRRMRAAGVPEGVQVPSRVPSASSELFGLPRYEDLQFSYKHPPPPYSGKTNEGYEADDFIEPPPYSENLETLHVPQQIELTRRARNSSMQELRDLVEGDLAPSVTLPLPRDRGEAVTSSHTRDNHVTAQADSGRSRFSETTV